MRVVIGITLTIFILAVLIGGALSTKGYEVGGAGGAILVLIALLYLVPVAIIAGIVTLVLFLIRRRRSKR